MGSPFATPICGTELVVQHPRRRLEDTCPRPNDNLQDREFRDRQQRSYVIALMAWGDLQKMLAVIRAGVVFREQHHLYARGPALVERCAFLFGRWYAKGGGGRHRAGRAARPGGGQGAPEPDWTRSD